MVENLSLEYSDGVESLTNVTLPIYENCINVLLGPAGGGKSSLLRSLNRLNDLTDVKTFSGKVLFDGVDVLSGSVDVIDLRRKIGMVFSRPVVLPMSIRENITYGLELAGERNKKKLDDAVERCLVQAALFDEVKDRLDDSANALSGGQKQRLCLARSLATEPEVILLDEPTSGLDPISTLKVESSLQSLKETYTIVLVPHSIQQAGRTSDFCAFILQGELIEHLPGDLMFTNPKNQQTKDYIEGRFG
ncbi:MAG TPA: phosphate ABC transporter ATP-binding protein [Anaerolineales bacterium]|nr:phosphate ABC transporter ATP-binding protein [Anaerolineales bacterium]